MKIKEVIVVEGKTDAQKISSCFPGQEIDFLISNGLGFTNNFLDLCKKTNESRGIIIFTDPDGPGNIIREKINSYLNFNCKNAFIDKKTIISKKIGVAEADKEKIIESLCNVIEFKGEEPQSINWKDYLDNDIYLKSNRIKIAKNFSWNENINSKTLFKWLNYTRLNLEDVLKLLGEKNSAS